MQRPRYSFITLPVILCGLLFLLSVVVVQRNAVAQSPGDETQKPPSVTLDGVRKALRRLQSEELQERDQAEKQLVELGPAVLPFLPEVTARTSGELKIRLQRIRQSLENSDVEAFFDASTVTLSGTMRIGDAIAEIAEQTGNEISLQGEDAVAGIEIEMAASEQPFWDALESVMSKANLRINAYGTTEGDLVLSPGGPPAGTAAPTFSTGPFRVELSSVQSTLSFNSQLEGQLQLSMQVTWEPRLKPVFMQIPMKNVALDLGDGKSLAATNPQASPEIPLNFGGCSTQVDLQVERPERSVEKIERLIGDLVVAVPSDRHKYVFEKFGNGARQSEKFGDVTVTLEGSRRNGAVYEMRVLVEFGDSNGALDSFRGWILSNEAYLLDGKESRMENVGLQTYAITANAVGIAYLFQINGNPDDFKLVYESPAAISKQTIRYELRDIKLP